MSRFRTSHWLCVILTMGLAATLFALFAAGATVHASAVERPAAQASAEPGDVIEVFNNAWMYQSSLGLVYDPDRGVVRYAHESQSSAKRPTVFDVDPVAHTAVLSFALSAKNSNWRWQIDNRDGAGYDYVAKTYFLPDYEGDLSYADDNIVEINRDGNIRNAWEMDNEVGSNDSADGSKIDTIIDIAVVPGNPNRYFVTAAYDNNIVYEIVLTRTGQLWKSKTWATLAKCRVPGLTDNLGIDYDAQYNRLYHSDWKSDKIVVTDLTCNDGQPMNVIAEFNCPGAGGYNSGVTFIEGSAPPEIWVTDFDKNKTTRCVAVGGGTPEPGWEKTVDGVLWTAELNHTTETAATFQVTDIITAGRPFTLTELWDAGRLRLTEVQVEPPLADIVTATGALTVTGDGATPDLVTVTKQFLTLPCTWTDTVVSEALTIAAGGGDAAFAADKPFTVTKTAPVLQLDSSPTTQNIYVESAAQFTLHYTNTGGFENAVVITGAFPVTAPFLYAEPEPDATAGDRSWARWDVGDLARDEAGAITVYVYAVDSTAEPLTVTHRIHNHVGNVAAEAETILHVTGETTPGWTKTIDDGSGPVVWSPTLSLTLETGDIFTATDIITVNESFILNALWLTSELTLKLWDISPEIYEPSVTSLPGALNFGLPAVPPMSPPRLITLTKVFTVNTCSWPQTVLLESLQIGTNQPMVRPVLVHKDAPILALSTEPTAATAHGGEVVTYTLAYTNSGAYENQFTARADFPAEAAFVSADPPPTTGTPGDTPITWVFTDGLAEGESGMITVTTQITDEVPPATRLVLTNTLLDHANVPKAVAPVAYEIEPPEWEKRVNDGAWDAPVAVEAGDEFTVTEVITTGASLVLVDRWPEAHLTLLTYTPSAGAGDIVTAAGRLTWTVDVAAPETVTLTKRFRTEVFTTAYTVLWENLYVGGAEWERRAVILERAIPDVRLTKTAAPGVAQPGEQITYTLTFSNAGEGTARGVVLTDTIPVSVTGLSVTRSGVVITNTGATPPYVWQIADLAPNAGGVITITGVLSHSLPASLLTNEAEIAAANQAQVGGASPGEDNRITAAASIAVDGDPLVCTLAPISGTTHAFCNGICGAVTFVNTGTVSSLTITFTQRFPSTGGEGLPRQYRLEANGSGFTARLTLCYADEELDIAGIPASDAGELRAFRYVDGGLWEAPSGQTVSTGDNTITIEGVTQFSAWGIGIPGEAQPTAVRQRQDRSGLVNLTAPGIALLALGLVALAYRAKKRHRA